MVDFDNEVTVATPAKEVMKIYLLQNKAYTEDSWRIYREKTLSGSQFPLTKVRAALEQWYLIIECMIERNWEKVGKEIKKEDILLKIETGNETEIRDMIIKFNRLLDELRLTRLDTKLANKKTWEASNLQYGY